MTNKGSSNGTGMKLLAGVGVVAIVAVALILAGNAGLFGKAKALDLGSDNGGSGSNNGGSNDNGNSGSTPDPNARIPANTNYDFLPSQVDYITKQTITEDTNVDTVLLNKDQNSDTGYSFAGAATTTAITTTMDESNNGYVYFTAKAKSSQAYIVDINALPSKITNHVFMDWDKDFKKEWVFTYDTKGYPSALQLSSGNPLVAPQMPWFHTNGAVTLTAPSAKTSIGTGTSDVDYNVKVTATAARAQVYGTLKMVLNSTSSDDWSEGNSWIELPFGKFYLSQATNHYVGASDQTYEWKIATTQEEAFQKNSIVTIANGGNADRYDTVHMEWMYDASEVTNIVLSYSVLDQADSPQTSSTVNWNNSA